MLKICFQQCFPNPDVLGWVLGQIFNTKMVEGFGNYAPRPIMTRKLVFLTENDIKLGVSSKREKQVSTLVRIRWNYNKQPAQDKGVVYTWSLHLEIDCPPPSENRGTLHNCLKEQQ